MVCSSLGRQAPYVDLEASPQIDKDNPPDLAHYLSEAAGPTSAEPAVEGTAAATEAMPVQAAPAPAGAASTSRSKSAAGASSSKAAGGNEPRLDDVYTIAEAIMEKVLAGFSLHGINVCLVNLL